MVSCCVIYAYLYYYKIWLMMVAVMWLCNWPFPTPFGYFCTVPHCSGFVKLPSLVNKIFFANFISMVKL